jgi:hypothetical protein
MICASIINSGFRIIQGFSRYHRVAVLESFYFLGVFESGIIEKYSSRVLKFFKKRAKVLIHYADKIIKREVIFYESLC